jgi:hypothetical protein
MNTASSKLAIYIACDLAKKLEQSSWAPLKGGVSCGDVIVCNVFDDSDCNHDR